MARLSISWFTEVSERTVLKLSHSVRLREALKKLVVTGFVPNIFCTYLYILTLLYLQCQFMATRM